MKKATCCIAAAENLWADGNRYRHQFSDDFTGHDYYQWLSALQQTELQVELAIPIEKLQDSDGTIDLFKSRDFNWNGLIKKAS